MSFVTFDVGEVLLLKYMLNHTAADNVRMHLYSNDRTPSDSDTLSGYTAVSVSGYTSKVLTGAAWTFATTSGTSTATYAQQSFTFSTSASVYGWYITNNGATEIIWAERFSAAPFSIPVSGGQIDVSPRLALD